jgi:hypothetical protein
MLACRPIEIIPLRPPLPLLRLRTLEQPRSPRNPNNIKLATTRASTFLPELARDAKFSNSYLVRLRLGIE